MNALRLKNDMPFRLGCTSYVIPADILPNVEKMAPLVDDIELVLFESPDLSNLPDARTVDRLADLAREHGSTFTVHFPTDRKAGSEDPAERRAFVAQAARIIDHLSPLNPHAYQLHLEGVFSVASPERQSAWQKDSLAVCQEISRYLPGETERVAVETLEFPWSWMASAVAAAGFSWCFDVGHAWRYGHDWQAMAAAILPRTRVVHLHGVVNGRDHKSLAGHDRQQLCAFLRLLRTAKYQGVLTLEVFNEADTFGSLELVRELWLESPC